MQSFDIPAVTKSVFSTDIEVRISDINYGGHLGHDALISLFHEARVRFLKKMGYESELNIDGCGMLVTKLAVHYINESFYSDKITINIEIGEITKTRLQLIYQAMNQEKNKEIARAMIVTAFYDYKKAKVNKIPDRFLLLVGENATLHF